MSLGAMLIGREYDVRLVYHEEYRLSVKAGPDRQQAIEEAELLCMNGPKDPTDWDLVHSEVDAHRDIFEDDPDAFEVADWLDAPTAPSEETYYNDERHFGTEEIEA